MGIKVIPTPIYTVRSFPLLPIPAPKLDFYSHSHGIPISIGNPIPMVISNVAVDRRNRQTDGRTPYRYIDSAAYTRAVSGIDLPVWALLRTCGWWWWSDCAGRQLLINTAVFPLRSEIWYHHVSEFLSGADFMWKGSNFGDLPNVWLLLAPFSRHT